MPIRLIRALGQTARLRLKASYDLFKIMIPVIVLVRVLEQLEVIGYLAAVIDPAMKLVGLPEQSGLIWATAMMTNLYAGMAVFVSLDVPMTAAQATVLTTMMLIAHNLSDTPQEAALDLTAHADGEPVDLLAAAREWPMIGEGPYSVALAPYESVYLLLKR